MDKERVISSSIREIRQKWGMLSEFENDLRVYMNYIYAAGYDEGLFSYNGKKVTKMDKYGNIIAKYNSVSHAARENNAPRALIGLICQGKNYHQTYKGFIYKFTD